MVIYPAPEIGNGYAIIEEIVQLLNTRRLLHISRGTFIRRYDRLRAALNETPEYQYLRRSVIHRSGGKCEKCKVADGEQLAHRKRVSQFPRLALVKSNVYWGCLECHQKDHPAIKVHRV